MEPKASHVSAPYDTCQVEHTTDLSAEFALDREFIIIALQNALKNKQFQDAHDIVKTYREAGKADEVFGLLAARAEERMVGWRNAAPHIALLQATPDDDYSERAALCQIIIEAIPDDAQEYRDELKRCNAALGRYHTALGHCDAALALSCSACKKDNGPYTLCHKKPLSEISTALAAILIFFGIPCFILGIFFLRVALVIFSVLAVSMLIMTLTDLNKTYYVCKTCLPKFTPGPPKAGQKALSRPK